MMYLLSKMTKFKTRKISINNRGFTAYIADTPLKQAVGLMFRAKLRKNECMVFAFRTAQKYGIWMRNMNFPIDIIWLDGQKRVVYIKHNAKPARGLDFTTHRPSAIARYVLELPSGTAKNIKINTGQRVSV